MKKIKNWVIGGLQNKIFNLVLITILLVVAAYTAVILYQSGSLVTLVRETNEQQEAAIGAISTQTMDAVASSSLSRSTALEAYIMDSAFRETAAEVALLRDCAESLFAAPERYSARTPDFPDASRDGTTCVQLMLDDGVSLSDPQVAADAALLGNMAEVMASLYDGANINSCYIATPSGVFIMADDRSGTKFAETGELLTIPARIRPWYTGAIENGGLYFSDVQKDIFTSQIGIFCSYPVYANGELKAVVGADLFLDEMGTAVEQMSDENNGFVCIINQNGHVVFAPDSQELFRVKSSLEAQDLRESPEAELAQFVNDALGGQSPVRQVNVGGTAYYMAGSSMDTVGWAIITVIACDRVMQPTAMMQEQYAAINDAAVGAFYQSIGGARRMILVLLAAVFVLATAAALILAKRIVKPLNTMTTRVSRLGGQNLRFSMENAYRTGDEIEVLAQAFADLSDATLQYMDELTRVTIEKERIGAELNVATQIQADMLPRIFPAFPGRDEFDIFASMRPAKEVGGDFYDFFLIDDNHLAMVMADVSGKGVPAALFMVIAKTLIKNRAQQGGTPSEILRDVNNQLCVGNDAGLFVTVWLGIVEISTGKGLAANAGHEHPALKHSDGSFELIKYRHSPAVATMEGIPFREHEFELRPGDKLFVYTDGVTEATNADNVLFGEARTVEALNRNPNAPPKAILDTVQYAIDDFVGDAVQFDDITMLCLHYRGPNQ